ncbi:MAG: class I SAM-dependent methyltransferase, partial [Candidatus Omnitrophica bacterium]|nr:class I SAM-dependent methyltransferase [Candidatus Omnitrophota bacterium]
MLKKGGKIVILEFSPPANTVFGGLHLFYLKNILPLAAGIFGGSCESYRYLSVSIAGFALPRQIIDQMKCSGLINVRHLSMRCGLVNVYYGEK